MELRGFDSYPITLGDEMRGERASLGKSLEDAERDLRIKRRMIVAIETCDLEGFPNRSVVAGYVRSYARYLGMDPDDCYRRFCAESGYQSPASMMAKNAGAGGTLPLLPAGAVGAEIANSRFAAPPSRGRFMAPVSLGALTSTAALLALIAGLSYGGWALLQDIQRVGFAPIPAAPAVVAEAPLITAPAVEAGALPLPDPRDYQDGGILAAVAAPAPLQPIEALRRDGPISAIDPRTSGVFASETIEDTVAGLYASQSEPPPAPVDSADDAIHAAALAASELAARVGPALTAGPAMATGPFAAGTALAAAEAPAFAIPATADAAALPRALGVSLHAAEDAWIRVREQDNVLFEGTLNAGQKFDLPPRVVAPVLKAGNAGGIFVVVDGVSYGPVGRRGQIARDISLAADDVRGSMPEAPAPGRAAAETAETHQRAEAAPAQQ